MCIKLRTEQALFFALYRLIGSSMDDIKELSEGGCESRMDSEELSTTLEENNNCTGTISRKSSSCDR
jgi:hypothetical protein